MKTVALLLIFGSLFFVGCAHAPSAAETKINTACRNIDWYEIGRIDGEVGTSPLKLQTYRKQCDDTPNPVRTDLYINGREAGLIDYCTGAGGFDAGKNGTPYEHVCPENTNATFVKNYEIGARVRKLENENAELDARIDNLNHLLLPTLRGSSVRAQINQLQSRRSNNDTAISDLEDRVGL